MPRYGRLWELSDDLLSLATPNGRIQAANAAWERTLGWTEDDLVGHDPLDFVHREDAERILDTLRRAREAKRFKDIEVRWRRADGSFCWLSWSGYREGETWYLVARDISALREAHEVARLSTWKWDPETDRLMVSSGLRDLVEDSLEESMRLDEALAFVPPPHSEDLRDLLRRVLAGEETAARVEYPVDAPSGEVSWVEMQARPVHDSQGRIVAVRGTAQDITARKQAELARIESEDRLREAQRIAGIGSFQVDHRAGTVLWSDELYRIFGREPDPAGALPPDLREMVPPDDRERFKNTWAEMLADGRTHTLAHRYLRGDEIRWAETRVEPLTEGAGRYGGRGTMQDITARKLAEREIDLQAHLLDAVDVSVIATDLAGTVTHWNRGAERMYGWTRDETIGRPVRLLAIAADQQAEADHVLGEIRRTGSWEGVYEVRRKDQTRFPAFVRDVLLRDAAGEPTGIVGVSVDVSERAETERQLRAARDYLRALTDSMGEGLFTLDTEGRLTYMNRAAETMLGWRYEELAGRVMHEATHFRRPDGQPYPIEECPLLHVRREGKLVRVADDVFIRKDGSDLPVEVTGAPFETEDKVRGTVVVFSDITERMANEQRLREQMESLSWVGQVRDAIAEDRLLLFAQPIVSVATGETARHELLIRLRDRDGRVVTPSSFLAAAEEFGLIVDIDRWVVGQAMEYAARGHAVSLNLSAHSLSATGLIDHFHAELARTGADPSLVVVELTETALLADERTAERFFDRIGAMGCKLALDDFGTGYGGFSYLKRLPVDFLKIDTEFVRDLLTNEASRHVVRAVASLAHGFGQQTIAEGVESRETLPTLRELGIDFAQGYAIARPAPATETFAG